MVSSDSNLGVYLLCRGHDATDIHFCHAMFQVVMVAAEPSESNDEYMPSHLRAEVLIGTMPTAGLMDEPLSRLTSQSEWKPMRVVLTDEAIFLARRGEDTLRDRIPLLEIVKVKKSNCIQRDESEKKDFRPGRKSISAARKLSRNGASLRSVSSLFDQNSGNDLHIIQIHTVHGGYNCGKVYHLNAESEERRTTWATALESAIAAAITRAAPHPLAVHQRWLRALYRHPWFQSAVAVRACISHPLLECETSLEQYIAPDHQLPQSEK